MSLLLLVASIAFLLIAAALSTTRAPATSDIRHQDFIAWKTSRLVIPIFAASAVLACFSAVTFALSKMASR